MPSSGFRLSQWFFPLAFSLLVLLIVGFQQALAADRLIFAMDDPAGDDHGAGSIVYPLDDAFYPHRDLLDLRRYEVWQVGEELRFEFLFGHIANPFHAPEGFYHPRIDVYLSLGGLNGRTEPLTQGPGVRFSPQWPWHAWLRVAPFGESALVTWEGDDTGPTRHPVVVEAVPDQERIRVAFPARLLPRPERSWRHYVIVGSFDGFGVDGYRGGASEPSRWLLGGVGEGDALVVDLLAPRLGLHTQRAQLGRQEGPPIIRPVGGSPSKLAAVAYGLTVVVFLLTVAATVRLFFRRSALGFGFRSNRFR